MQGVAPVGILNCTLESDKTLCVRASEGDNPVLFIFDLQQTNDPPKKHSITADSAIMHPKKPVLALRHEGTLQVFNVKTQSRICESELEDDIICFWKWLNHDIIGIVGEKSVYHMDLQGSIRKMFDRSTALANCQIVRCKMDSTGNYMAIIGLKPTAEGVQQFCNNSNLCQKIGGMMQLCSLQEQVSQDIEAYAASFTTLYNIKNRSSSNVLVFCGKQKVPCHSYVNDSSS